MNIRPTAITDDSQSSWRKLVSQTMNSKKLLAGNGLSVTQGSDHTRIAVDDEPDASRWNYRGNYDINSEYKINDVVRVVPNVEYKSVSSLNSGSVIPIGAAVDDGLDVCPISLGLFICVQYVPPAFANEEYFDSFIATSFGDTIPLRYQQGTRWDSLNVYYPVYPEISTNKTASVDSGYGFDVIANNTFWNALPFGTMPTELCVNGKSKTFYMVGAESGSVFNATYLPYQDNA